MASAKSCPDCGSSNLVDDALYSQVQLVCTDCGSVVSEGLLTTTQSEEVQGTDIRYRESTAVDKQPCRNQIQGLRRVRALCRILRFPRVIEETAEGLFSRAYEHPTFLKVRLQKKEVLGGSCVLLSSRQHNWPIAMGTICSLLQASEHAVGAVYQELVKSLNVEPTSTSITDLLESHCSQYKLSPTEVQEVFSESTARLVQRASTLVELAADTWLVTGRHPVPILVCTVYLAWLSLKPCKARLNVPLGKFCKMAKVGMPGKAAARVAELKEVLCRLGKELPWLRGEAVEPRTVPTLMDDIIKYRDLLMTKAMRSFESELSTADPDPEPDRDSNASIDPGLEGALSPLGEMQETALAKQAAKDNIGSGTLIQASDWPSGETHGSCGEHPHGRATCSSDAIPEQETTTIDLDAEGSPAPGRHWGKSHLFVPPCARNPRKRRRTEEAGPAVTGYEEISDSEIEGYLRTPQEMEEFAEIQKKLLSTNQ
ncbi:hypothetical protein AAFF_G00251610 [Aldrovandia affinis]|uniref:Transcription factor IIIB 50 kDa subunit n=1 Tax=Aldrovandia affinis TaxID=143900 RepID=A0AAD7STN0_9TELE|nr:hypothetical protein AAFF_G00251610 [Aldrovandia affinis]